MTSNRASRGRIRDIRTHKWGTERAQAPAAEVQTWLSQFRDVCPGGAAYTLHLPPQLRNRDADNTAAVGLPRALTLGGTVHRPPSESRPNSSHDWSQRSHRKNAVCAQLVGVGLSLTEGSRLRALPSTVLKPYFYLSPATRVNSAVLASW